MKRLLNEINSEEYQEHKKWLDKEQALIKKGYDRIQRQKVDITATLPTSCKFSFPRTKIWQKIE